MYNIILTILGVVFVISVVMIIQTLMGTSRQCSKDTGEEVVVPLEKLSMIWVKRTAGLGGTESVEEKKEDPGEKPKKEEFKREEFKKEDSKKEAPEKEAPEKEVPKKEDSKKEVPEKEVPKKEDSKKEVPETEDPKVEQGTSGDDADRKKGQLPDDGQKTMHDARRTSSTVDTPPLDYLFYDECIKPYIGSVTQDVRKVVEVLLKLLDMYGNNSSVVVRPGDTEAGDISTVIGVVRKVTLRDHTYSVTRILINSVKKVYWDYAEMVPPAIVAGLGHDIGKIPELTQGDKRSHEILSGEILEGIIQDVQDRVQGAGFDKIKEVVLSAVKNHHTQTNEQFTVLLKEADQTARGYELAMHTQGMKVLPFTAWFEPEEYVNTYIAPEVNVSQGNTCQAFSFNGIVYVRTDYLYKAGQMMCRDKNVIDVRMLYDSEEQNVIRRIVNELRTVEYIHPILESPRIMMKCELVQKMGIKNTTMTVTPFVGNIFNLETLEKRKADFLVNIKDVVVK